MQDRDTLRLVSEITVTRPPIIVAKTKISGWRNLIVAVSGGGMPPVHSAGMQFGEKIYLHKPTVEPVQQVGNQPDGTVLIEINPSKSRNFPAMGRQ